ncbi:MAG: response regulator [Balneolaceae bacterium]|nr:response regulator [Balneolaceae bacterium]
MGGSGKKILIVEDNAVQAMMMEKFFEELNHTVLAIVDRGEKAVRKADTLQPDLIIMDIFLNGDMTGIQAMEKIRETSNVSVIYISGNSDPYYRSMAENTNFADFFYKPVDHGALRKAVQQVFKNEGNSKELRQSDSKKWSWPFSLFL